jgi:hypothetical protein
MDEDRLDSYRKWVLRHAAADFFFMLNRSYPRAAALDMVGNRYNLGAAERMLLQRGVLAQEQALGRRAKRMLGESWREEPLVVDAHNVQITIESYIEGRPLLKANDGAMRDIAGLSARFRLTETTSMVIEMIFSFFDQFPPREVIFLFDEPMSRSGELASIYRARLKKERLSGDARAVPVPEREFPYEKCIVASSDGAVLDSSRAWMDLACGIIEFSGTPELAADFSGLILSSRRLFDNSGAFPY